MSCSIPRLCDLIRHEASKRLHDGSVAVDATLGNGHDTLFLCDAVGESGRVFGFDIQPLALERTKERLNDAGLAHRAQLILAGHERMADYIEAESVEVILFNLGYLPNGDHGVVTKAETTVAALKAGLNLLKVGGTVFIAVYWGHPGGKEEKKAVSDFAASLPSDLYDTAAISFPNKNKAPLALIIQKK